ncbi:MAG: poly-gamma-glutamate synthase PgsB [candidate division WOR-3 bacterium]|nr:MAG: poly-gamma-glutamate synthase PgsB [candidate division WOR-3 bacterium]
MFFGIYAVLVLIGLYVLFLRIEKVNHEKRVKSIPVRIWVNGSRGKSSVTRLIAAGLRGGGKKVIAKTTGTRASFITDNRNEQPVIRLGMPNIREQVKIFRKASKDKPDIIVLECMALRPDLQYSEAVQIVKPTTVVITNVRPDHLDVMGPSIKDITKHFLNAVPNRATLFVGEKGILKDCQSILRTKKIDHHFSDANRIPDTMIVDFHYIEHKSNVALALDVCRKYGVSEKDALAAMLYASPDPGVLRKHLLALGEKEVTLINAMAANDPDSTYMIWQMIDKNYREINVLINCRIDRIDRSFQMAKLIKDRMPADRYILTGSGTHILARKLYKTIEHEKVLDAGEKKPENTVQAVADTVSNRSLIFAMGNTVGYGEEMVKQFLLHERNK